MKSFSPALAAHLAGGATTICACFRVERRDGAVLGFTDHDRALAFDGVTYEPESGLDASGAVAHAGLQVGGFDAAGAFASDRITEADLEAGLYDNARVETFLVNWADVAARALIRIGHIGEVRREGQSFAAEVRSLSHALDQERGRTFRHTCDADLGDTRCGVDLTDPAWRSTGTVIVAEGGRLLRVALSEDRAASFFDGGALVFSSGENDGRRIEVLRHDRRDGEHVLHLWQALAGIAVGDTFAATAGCDKRFATCRDRFANSDNFRGFPHMPGNDFALSYARQGDRNSGQALRD